MGEVLDKQIDKITRVCRVLSLNSSRLLNILYYYMRGYFKEN